MKILGIDFETTFTDPVDATKCRIVEAGAVLWDTERAQPLRVFNQVVPWSHGPFDPRVTDLTGMVEEDFNLYGRPLKKVLENLIDLMSGAEIIAAHNGNNFDKPLFFCEAAREAIILPERIQTMLWIDTSVDVPYPPKIETRKLEFLAPSHKFLNPFAHRAIFDVLSMLKVLSHYDINEVVKRATAQKVRLKAVTEKPWNDGGKSNNKAKERGFRFDGESKLWLKTVLESEVADELAKGDLIVEVYK